MANIHPTAVIESGAQIAESATIGPFCVIGPSVTIGENVELRSNVVVSGKTTIGEGTKVFPFAVLGQGAQHLKYMDIEAELIIGKNNVIREHVTMHLGTPIDKSRTTVGDNGLFMVNSHIAHDCVVGNNVIMTNNAVIGGHVHLGDFAILGGNSAVHQFCRVGKHAMVGGMSGVEQDVIPYGMVVGDRARLNGLNVIGLKRRGFTRDEIKSLRSAYRMLFAKEGTFSERLEDASAMFADVEPVMDIVRFMKEDSSRAVCQPE